MGKPSHRPCARSRSSRVKWRQRQDRWQPCRSWIAESRPSSCCAIHDTHKAIAVAVDAIQPAWNTGDVSNRFVRCLRMTYRSHSSGQDAKRRSAASTLPPHSLKAT